MARIESIMNQPVQPSHQQPQQESLQVVESPQYVMITMGTIFISTLMLGLVGLIIYFMYWEDVEVVEGGTLIFVIATSNFFFVYLMMHILGQQQDKYEEQNEYHLQELEEKTMAVLGKFQMVHEKYEETEKKYLKLQKKYFKVQTELEQERRKKPEPVISDGNGTGIVEHPTDT